MGHPFPEEFACAPFWSSFSPAPVASADALDDLLARAGLAREDMGWRPRGYWNRYPADIPFKLRHFDDCLAEPLATVNLSPDAGESAKGLLAAEALAKAPEKSAGGLYRRRMRWGGAETGFVPGVSTNLRRRTRIW